MLNTTPYAISEGLQIYYETFGHGKPILLIHGWGSDLKHNWVDTGWVKDLQSERRVITLDCRGHGRSDKPHDQKVYSYSIMARDVLNLMDHLNIAKTDIFGYSMGAFMTIHLLGHNQERFNSVIMGGIGEETEESKDAGYIADALRAKDPSQITNQFGRALRAFIDLNPNNDREALALSALQMWPEGYPIQIGGVGLADVDIPVLIINGEDDEPYVRTDQKLANTIPSAKLVRIPNKNHFSVIIDPHFKKEILRFLQYQ
ncbi:MAG: alpha/beta fold hydrolase [Candidatus Thorarchaeota archaeon]